MQVQRTLRISEYDADDATPVEASRQILDAARAVDTPFLPRLTSFRRAMDVRLGWDGSPELHLLAQVDEKPVAVADVELGEWDNRDLAWITLVVDPAHRRRGYGSELLSAAIELSAQRGRTKVGAEAWDCPSAKPFAQRHGFVLAQAEAYRVVAPRELPPGLVDVVHTEAATHAHDYELVRIAGHTPEELLPALSELTAFINDAPLDDLEMEDEAFPVERLRAFEDATAASGHRLYRVLALHKETGEAAGHTIVSVDTDTPSVAHQDDTTVARQHRGHRLGLLLKAEMMRWLAEAEPQITTIDTDNAESNRHMIAVNERLGYRVLGRILQFQRR